MDYKEFARIIKKAEKRVDIAVRVRQRLQELKLQVDDMFARGDEVTTSTTRTREEDWPEVRRLARRGKHIAKRFGDRQMQKYFGVIFNTASTYLGLPGDKDQMSEMYALTKTTR